MQMMVYICNKDYSYEIEPLQNLLILLNSYFCIILFHTHRYPWMESLKLDCKYLNLLIFWEYSTDILYLNSLYRLLFSKNIIDRTYMFVNRQHSYPQNVLWFWQSFRNLSRNASIWKVHYNFELLLKIIFIQETTDLSH